MNEQRKKGSLIPVRCRDRKFIVRKLGSFLGNNFGSTASKPPFKFISVVSLK